MTRATSAGTLALVYGLGWALVHSLWQSLLVALIFAGMRHHLRRQRASRRYLVACAALALMSAAPVLTACIIYRAVRGLGEVEGALFEISRQANEPTLLLLFLPWLVVCWSLGMLALSLRLLGGWVCISRLQRWGAQPVGLDLQARVAAMASQLGVRAVVRVFESIRVEVPTVVGWLRPAPCSR